LATWDRRQARLSSGYDRETGQWRALDARGLYQRRAYLTEVYPNELAKGLLAAGYELENRWNEKHTDLWVEIKKISPVTCGKFSKRSEQRDEAIEEFKENERPQTEQQPSDQHGCEKPRKNERCRAYKL
jgi:TrwC relaxase